jgi:histidyl-tRNA synthetase
VTDRIQAIRGMNDVLPYATPKWQHLERILVQCLSAYGYHEIRFPIVENTQLFKRTIGDHTDIVEKEMYTFQDLNQESLTLRPEGTAGCIRACLEHGLLHNQQQKLWYAGPMFRHEKPQKGRYRQFHQFGVEALGFSGVGVELELILLARYIWTVLGIQHSVTLQINTLGELAERQTYRQVLLDYLMPHQDQLDEECKRRLHRSPIRILDSKNPALKTLIAAAPKLIDHVSAASRERFVQLTTGLDALGVPYQINHALVRGLDYYGHTVFEWVTDRLGAQATICAGGRYDGLVEQLGGQPTPAVGLGIGVERLMLLMEQLDKAMVPPVHPDVFMITEAERDLPVSLAIAELLRQTCQISVVTYLGQGRIKNQFKQADKSGARLALILGEEEMQKKMIGIKDLRGGEEQKMVMQAHIVIALSHYF